MAIDGPGDVWLPFGIYGSIATTDVVELIGAAVAVVTMIAAGLTSPDTPASRP